MATMIAEVYSALKEAGASEEKSEAAKLPGLPIGRPKKKNPLFL